MDLTLNEIKNITFGAVAVTEEADGFCFARCTEKQMAAWRECSDFLGYGSRCTTGIRLDFHTNSSRLSFSASAGNKFELYVDGLFCRRFEMNKLRKSGEKAEFDLCAYLGASKKKGELSRVTLFLPSHEIGVIESLTLDDGAEVIPHKFDMKLLFIGDSITQGWDSYYDSMAYAPRVASFFNADSVNQGIGGSFFNEDAFDSIDFTPDATIVAYGTNDWGYRKSLESLFDHATAHLSLIKDAFGKNGKPIFVISPIWRQVSSDKLMGSFDECRETIIKAAEALGLIHVNGLSLVPHDSDFFADKTLHPNDLGFSIYAEKLTRAILSNI